MPATVALEHRRRPRPCCRCGQAPRWNDTYLCLECHASPAQREERQAAERIDPIHTRLLLIRWGWTGGWTRNEAGSAG